MGGYLFAHFIGEEKDGEQIYFSLSKDGLHWNDLKDGKYILKSNVGELGVRDPFLIRDEAKKQYYLIATDLRIEAGKGWGVAQYGGSQNLVVWDSTDLIHWNGPKLRKVGIEGAGCVWAPEAIYDEEKQSFLVFWASMVKLSGDTEAKQRIYGSYTKDFTKFSEPFLMIERENHVIDTTMVRCDGHYYRFSKDETTKVITMEQSTSLKPETFEPVNSETLSHLFGVEGPEIYQLPDGTWCLIVDRYAEGKGYLPLISKNLASGEFQRLPEDQFDMGHNKKRHGGILRLTEEEYQNLKKEFN